MPERDHGDSGTRAADVRAFGRGTGARAASIEAHVVLVVSPCDLERELLATALQDGWTKPTLIRSSAGFPGSHELPDVVVYKDLRANAPRSVPAAVASSVVAVVDASDARSILTLAASGVQSFVSVEDSLGVVREAVETCAAGGFVCPPDVTRVLLAEASNRHRVSALDLTRREREIADLLVAGLTNKEIARRHAIALNTAKNHVRAILKKLGVQNRTAAAAVLRELLLDS